MRVGLGYDVHRLVEGRELVLGGVNITYTAGLLGHSDADVLCHAIADALLGAAALDDIGRQFPETDAAYEGISSLLLLSRVADLLEEAGYKIGNVDSVIIAEKPKLAPYISQMRENIAEALSILPAHVGVKATTTEGLGFCGTEQGMAAQAAVLIEAK